MSSNYARIAKAIAFVSEHRKTQPKLEEVAAHVGLSAFHFQRLFQTWAGVTPKEYLQAITLVDAKRRLSEDRSLLDTALEVGLSGPSRLHDLFLKIEKMTPGEFKSGVAIDWTMAPTPFGEALFAATSRGLVRLSFLDEDADPEEELRQHWPNATLRRTRGPLAPYIAEVQQRMSGQTPRATLAIALHGSPLRLNVWQALLAIPQGECASYGTVARSIGQPRSVRAVASAIGENPIAVLLPCHRVLRESGALGGYRWGLVRKRALLASEALGSLPKWQRRRQS